MYKLNMYMLSEINKELNNQVQHQSLIEDWCTTWIFDEGLDGNYELGVCCKEIHSLLDVEIGF